MLMKYGKEYLCKSGCCSSRPHWWRILLTVSILFVFIINIDLASGKKDKNIQRAKSTLTTKPEWARKRTKSSECRLGRVRYPLNATWSPDLGPPFGVWKCVKCTCTPVQKKRRIVAKVLCRNIKNECPQIKCSNAVLAPGSCCKICPGEKGLPEGFIMEEPETENLSDKDFAVLLNGRTTRSPVTTKSLATGRLFLRRGTLHFSFVFSGSTVTPSTIQFMNDDGDILEELEPQPTPYEVNNGRLCGSWTRVPRQYRTLLMNEKLWVALVPPDGDDTISGRISRYKGVETEVFSALLSPKVHNHSLLGGGTAIISASASSDSLHISLVFNGIFQTSDASNVSITVELRPSRNLLPVKDTIVLRKVYSDINVAEIKTTLGEKSLLLLTRGKVDMIVMCPDYPELRLEGPVIARATCNVYHSVLTSYPESSTGNTLPPLAPFGAGWGLLYVLNEGDFKYQMKLSELPFPVEKITLQLKTRKKTKDLEDITNSYTDGWVNGTYGNPTFRDLDTLFRGRLQVSVTMTGGGNLKGLFEVVSVTEALRSLHPSLLRTSSSWMAATTWVAVDMECVMHYDVYLSGQDPSGALDPTWSLQLRENDTSWDPRLDQVNVTLEHIISGREIAAHTTTLSKVSLSRLDAGVVFLDLTISDSSKAFEPAIVLSGRLSDVMVPPLCLLFSNGEGTIETSKSSNAVDDSRCKGYICLDEEVKPIISKKCIDDDKRVYEDGSTWKSPLNNCARCLCTLGKINCQDEPCPATDCSDAITLPGQCCRSCPAVSGQMSERVCQMGEDNFHNIGSFWHPFLAPKGFDLCVTCYCNVTHNGDPVVECRRVSCPTLDCSPSETKHKDGSCCPECPPSTPPPKRQFALPPVIENGYISEGVVPLSLAERKRNILQNGGCLERKKTPRSNGETWYPFSICISCTCKDGKISCFRDECPDVACRKGTNCQTSKETLKSKKNKFHRKRKNRRKKMKNKRQWRY